MILLLEAGQQLSNHVTLPKAHQVKYSTPVLHVMYVELQHALGQSCCQGQGVEQHK